MSDAMLPQHKRRSRCSRPYAEECSRACKLAVKAVASKANPLVNRTCIRQAGYQQRWAVKSRRYTNFNAASVERLLCQN